MGVMVLLLGGVAIALSGRGGEGAALVNAQSLISGLVGTTRAQAALHQTNARLVVYAQMPPAGDASNGSGCAVMCCVAHAHGVSASNGRRPVSIS